MAVEKHVSRKDQEYYEDRRVNKQGRKKLHRTPC